MNKEDAFINSLVEEAFRNARLLRNSDIKIATRNGQVVLSGIVDVLAEKWVAGEIAARIPGIAAVDNSLTVAIDRMPEDGEIAKLVQDKLGRGTRAALHLLTATVKDGVVFLEGEVDTIAEEKTAKELAAGIAGVKDVISYLNLGTDGFSPDDATVTNSVQLALSRSDAVSQRGIELSTLKGKVTLVGIVDTPEQIIAAAEIAGDVPGVKQIVNKLVAINRADTPELVLANSLQAELDQ